MKREVLRTVDLGSTPARQREVLRTFAAMLMEIAELPRNDYQTRAARTYFSDLGELMRNWVSGEIGLSEFDTLIEQNVGRHLPSSAGSDFEKPRRAPRLPPAERPRIPAHHRGRR